MKCIGGSCIISPYAFLCRPYPSFLQQGLHRVKKSRVNKCNSVSKKIDGNRIPISHVFPEGSEAHGCYRKLCRNFYNCPLHYQPVCLHNFRRQVHSQISHYHKKVYITPGGLCFSRRGAEQDNCPYEASKLFVDFIGEPVGSVNILPVIPLKIRMLPLRNIKFHISLFFWLYFNLIYLKLLISFKIFCFI